MGENTVRTYELITSGYKKTRPAPGRGPTRDAPPRVAVNGVALDLTLDSGLRRVENGDLKQKRV